jgi:branched-chain amino acid transport system substrate-binding protein
VAGSNGTIGTVDYVKEKGMVMYVSFASAPGVTWPFAKNLFRGGTTEVPRYGELYAEYLVDGLKAKKIGIISGREEYPKNEGDALTKQLQKWYELAPVKRVEFNLGDKDFTPQLLEMQQADPQVIGFFGNPAEAAIAMRQARELGLNEPFFVGSNMVDQGLLTAAGPAAEGVSGFALIPLVPNSSDSAMKAWRSKWSAKYPNLPAGRPNTFDILAYADIYAIAEAMRNAGKDLSTTSFIDALENLHEYRVSPIASPRTFTKIHHIGNLGLTAMQVKNGEWAPVHWQSQRPSDILKRYQ